MTLGVARRDDLNQLASLLAMLFSMEREFSPDEAKQRRALQMILDDPSVGTVYVARLDAKVIGSATLLYTVSTAEGGRAALLEDLIVLPQFRGRGVGSSLVRFVIEDARKQGILRLTLFADHDNERARSLYRKLGFSDSTMTPMRLRLSPAPQRSSSA